MLLAPSLIYVRYVWKMYFLYDASRLFISAKLIDWHDILDSHFLADKDTEVLKGQMCSIK